MCGWLSLGTSGALYGFPRTPYPVRFCPPLPPAHFRVSTLFPPPPPPHGQGGVVTWVGPVCRTCVEEWPGLGGSGEDGDGPGPWFQYRWVCLQDTKSSAEVAVKLFSNSRASRFEGFVRRIRVVPPVLDAVPRWEGRGVWWAMVGDGGPVVCV
jgi:hypothetical protein